MKKLLPIIFIFVFSFSAYGQYCNYSVLFDGVPSVYLRFFSFADGGSFGVVKSGTNCYAQVYKFSTNTPWIGVNSSFSSDSGSYYIAENTGTEPRSGLIYYTNYIDHTNGFVQIYQDAKTCPVTLSEQNISPGGDGASGIINVTADTSCKWSARKIADWITLNPSVEQTGGGSISYSVAPNDGVQRRATIKINGQRVIVDQANGCTFTPSATSASIAPAGANSGFTIQANGGCEWHAVSQSDWITVNLGASWSGSGTVGYTIAANTASTSRTGMITFAGQIFTVNQAGVTPMPTPTPNPTPAPTTTPSPTPSPTPTPACTYSLGASGQTFTYSGGSGLIDIITQSGCAYTGTNNDSFVTLQNSSGTGSGTINFDVAANSSGAARTATITIQGQIFTVSQSGVGKTRKRIRMF